VGGPLDYGRWMQEALRGVVRRALERAASKEGLPGEHHFFLTFRTRVPGVEIPAHLVEEYPEEMTIVLKRHFWDLEIGEDNFSIGLSFHQKPERLVIPLAAIRRFVDPAAPFALEFQLDLAAEEPAAPPEPEDKPAEPEQDGDPGGRVVSLDAFRKK
jgi:hypothetical protein